MSGFALHDRRRNSAIREGDEVQLREGSKQFKNLAMISLKIKKCIIECDVCHIFLISTKSWLEIPENSHLTTEVNDFEVNL